MHLVTLPVVGDGLSPETAFRPRLPPAIAAAPRGWVQASEMPMGVFGGRLCAVRAEDAALEALSRITGAIVHSRVATAVEDRAMHEALLAPSPRWQECAAKRQEIREAVTGGAPEDVIRALREELRTISADVSEWHRTPLAEYVAAYRPAAAIEESRERARLGIFALSTLHQDTFNRSNRSLNGDTMSDGLGTWADDLGTWGIVTNVAEALTDFSPGLGAVLRDSAASAVDAQRTSITSQAISSGAVIRYATATKTGYMYFRPAAGASVLYKMDVDAVSYTSLATGSSAVNGTVLGCDGSGSSITGYFDGSVDAGPATDATYATGVMGIYGTSGIPTRADDFLAEVGVIYGALVGRSVSRAAAYGSLTGLGAMSGRTVARAVPRGLLTGYGALAGRSVARSAARGAASGLGALSARTVARLAKRGLLTGLGALSGRSVARAVARGLLTSSVVSTVPSGARVVVAGGNRLALAGGRRVRKAGGYRLALPPADS